MVVSRIVDATHISLVSALLRDNLSEKPLQQIILYLTAVIQVPMVDAMLFIQSDILFTLCSILEKTEKKNSNVIEMILKLFLAFATQSMFMSSFSLSFSSFSSFLSSWL